MFYYGCVRESRLDFSNSNLIDLRGGNGTNAHGTYSFPKACLRSCAIEYNSLTIAVSQVGLQIDHLLEATSECNISMCFHQETCICFESTYDLDKSPVTKSSGYLCKADIKNGKMSLAYFDKGGDNRLHHDHCGPIQMGGAQKCNGSWKDTAHLNSAYSSNSVCCVVTFVHFCKIFVHLKHFS